MTRPLGSSGVSSALFGFVTDFYMHPYFRKASCKGEGAKIWKRNSVSAGLANTDIFSQGVDRPLRPVSAAARRPGCGSVAAHVPGGSAPGPAALASSSSADAAVPDGSVQVPAALASTSSSGARPSSAPPRISSARLAESVLRRPSSVTGRRRSCAS